MHNHLPRNFTGPVRGSPAWWEGLEPQLRSNQETGRKGTRKRNSNSNDPQSAPDTTPTSIRHELVARVRKEIEAGTYDSPDKWEAALDRLLERLGED